MTQLPIIPVGLVERITVRLLSALLGPANAIAPTLDEWEKIRFYAIKGRVLTRWGTAMDTSDWQKITHECRGCDGTGTWGRHRRNGGEACYRCCGTGIYAQFYIELARFELGRRVFHRPGRSLDSLPEGASVTFDGFVKHAHPGVAGWESLLWLALIFDRFLFREVLIRSDAPRRWTWRPLTNLHQNAQAWMGRWRWVLAHLPHRCCVCKCWLPPSLYCCDACLPF